MFSPMREMVRRFKQSHPTISNAKDKETYRYKSSTIIKSSDNRRYQVMSNGEWRRISNAI